MTFSAVKISNKAPLEVRRAFRQAPKPQSSQEVLLRAVCARAVHDALGMTGESEVGKSQQMVNEARKWFRDYNDAEDMFDMAGIEFDDVRNTVLKTDPVKKPKSKKKS